MENLELDASFFSCFLKAEENTTTEKFEDEFVELLCSLELRFQLYFEDFITKMVYLRYTYN